MELHCYVVDARTILDLPDNKVLSVCRFIYLLIPLGYYIIITQNNFDCVLNWIRVDARISFKTLLAAKKLKSDQPPLTAEYLSLPALYLTSFDPLALLDWSQAYIQTYFRSGIMWWNNFLLDIRTADWLTKDLSLSAFNTIHK